MKLMESVLGSPILLDEARMLLDMMQGKYQPLPPGWRIPPRLQKIAQGAPAEVLGGAKVASVATTDDHDWLYHKTHPDPHGVLELLSVAGADESRLHDTVAAALKSSWVGGAAHGVSGYQAGGSPWGRRGPIRLSSATIRRALEMSYWSSLETLGAYNLRTHGTRWANFCLGPDHWHMNGEYAMYIETTGQLRARLMTWDQVLMIKDLTYSRFLSCLTIDTQASTGRPVLDIEEYEWVEDWLESCLRDYGNAGFGILKGLEALAKAAAYKGVEKTLGQSLDSLTSMTKKIRDKEDKIGRPSTNRAEALAQFLLPRCVDTAKMVEIFGMMKLAGHPHVNPMTGLGKSAKLALEERPISDEAVRDLRRHACHMFCRGFLQKENRLPKLSFYRSPSDNQMSSLEKLYRSPRPHLNMVADNYDIADWDKARFCQEYNYDAGEDILGLISDRAISVERDELWSTWKEWIPTRLPDPRTSRRALLEVIQRPDFSLQPVIDRVSTRTVPMAWKVVCVTPKEREMKPDDPRMFSMMVLEMRTFFANNESNIARGLFQHVPHQTMTLSGLDLKKRFIELSSGVGPDDARFVTLYVEVDLSSWNLFWRDRTTHEVYRDLDDLYGVDGLFTYLHPFFEESLCLLRHPAYPPLDIPPLSRPEPSPSCISWTGHAGGFEGIGQKGWTYLTAAVVHKVATKRGANADILGQGDNQVIAVRLPRSLYKSDEAVTAAATSILEDLQSEFQALGHEVKPEECLVSTAGFSYGKDFVINGVFYPSTIKGLSRIFPTRTADTPSTTEALAEIWSGALASAEKSDNAEVCYSVAAFVASLSLRREANYSALHGPAVGKSLLWPMMTKAQQSDCVYLSNTLPGTLGGLKIATFYQFMYKGSADPLVANWTWLAWLSRTDPLPGRALSWLLTKSAYHPSPDIANLLENPFSLPLRKARDPALAIRDMVRERLDELTANHTVREILNTSPDDQRDKFREWLASLRPYYPKPMSDIYDATPFADIDRFAARFTNTRTLIGRTAATGLLPGEAVVGADLTAWANFGETLKWILRHPTQQRSPSLALSDVTEKRLLWGVGPLAGIGATHPMACMRVTKVTDALIRGNCDGVVLALIPHPCPGSRFKHRGLIDPYFGGSTLAKNTEKGVKLVHTGPPIRRAVQLLQIRDLIAQPGSKTDQFLQAWAQCRTDVKISDLEPAVPRQYGGAMAHRYQTSKLPEGALLNSTPMLSTHIQFSSDLCGLLGSGSEDRALSHQELNLALRYMIETLPQSELCLSGCFVGQLYLSKVPPLPPSALVDTEGGLSWPSPPSLPLNYYLKTNVVKYTAGRDRSVLWRGTRGQVISPLDDGVLSETALTSSIRSLLVDSMTNRREIKRVLEDPTRVAIGKSPIDIPESRRLTWPIVRDSCAVSVLDMVLLPAILSTGTDISVQGLYTSLAQLAGPVCRALYSSVRETLLYLPGALPPGVLPPPGARGHLNASLQFGVVVTGRLLELVRAHAEGRQALPQRRGFTDMSWSESAKLGFNALVALLLGSATDRRKLGDSRKLARLLRELPYTTNGEDEALEKVSLVAEELAVWKSDHLLVYQGSPQEVLRLARTATLEIGEPGPFKKPRSLPKALEPPPSTCACTTTGLILMPPDNQDHPNRDIKAAYGRNLLKPLALVSSAAYTWSPVLGLVSNEVMVIGVGAGGLCDLLIRYGHTVTGTDLRSSLSPYREHFPRARLSAVSDPSKFQLHPSSWMTSGDITDEQFFREILSWATEKRSHRCVLIDVEGVSLGPRWRFFSSLASSGVSVGVKLYCPSLGDSLAKSICALGANKPGSRLWAWPSSVLGTQEVVVYTGRPLNATLYTPTESGCTGVCSSNLELVRSVLPEVLGCTYKEALEFHVSRILGRPVTYPLRFNMEVFYNVTNLAAVTPRSKRNYGLLRSAIKSYPALPGSLTAGDYGSLVPEIARAVGCLHSGGVLVAPVLV